MSGSRTWGRVFGEGKLALMRPISPVQRPSLRTQVPVSSVPMPPVLDARTAGAHCPLLPPGRMLSVLAVQSTLPPEWWVEVRTTWGGPAPDPI